MNDLNSIPAGKLDQLFINYKFGNAIRLLTKGITHEFNNIFTGLAGLVNILFQRAEAGEPLSQMRRELIEDLIRRGTLNTELLFEFVRKVSRTKKLYSPEYLVEKAAALLNIISPSHHFELKPGGELPKVEVSGLDIILTLFYLGENAMEAMPEGGIIQFQVVYSDENGGTVIFQVLDQGCGFPETVIKRAFQPFVTTKEDEQLFGLGLYVAKLIVTGYSGRIGVENREGGGAVVSLFLPAEQMRPPERDRPAAETIGGEELEPKGRHVFLIVDDEEAMRALLRDRLEDRGHIVFCVESCAEACTEFSQLSEVISAILLDIGLKDSSGFECAQQLKAINTSTKIILMSGMELDPSFKLDCSMSYLQKPFSINQVEKIVYDDEI